MIMINIEKKLQEEIDSLSGENKALDLEEFILNGVDNEIFITVDYPLPNGETEPLSAKIRPLSSNEWNSAVRQSMTMKNSFQLNIVEKGLLTKNGETFPSELINKMPSGVIDAIFHKISEISGVKQDKKEQMEAVKEIMGF